MKIDRPTTEALDQPAVKRSGRKKKRARHSVVVGGVRYPLLQNKRSKTWRIRKRTAEVNIDRGLGVTDLESAEEEARRWLGQKHEKRERLGNGGASAQEVIECYRRMPTRCTEKVKEANIQRFTKLMRDAWGKAPAQVRASEFPSLWEDYAKVKQGGKLDLSTRTHENRGVNSGMRMAVSLFHEGLEERYERAGITLDFKAIRRVPWLPIIPSKLPKLSPENVKALMEALPALKETDRPMWRAVMIARYAGLRSREVSGACKSWLAMSNGAWSFEVRDRPEDKWWHKTGADYTAPIMSPELIEDLLACPDGLLVPSTGSRDHFFRKVCNRWLRQFIPRPNKGMHRLRALYAEALKEATSTAVFAHQAGLEAAQKALGHTTSKTTERSYLPAA